MEEANNLEFFLLQDGFEIWLDFQKKQQSVIYAIKGAWMYK